MRNCCTPCQRIFSTIHVSQERNPLGDSWRFIFVILAWSSCIQLVSLVLQFVYTAEKPHLIAVFVCLALELLCSSTCMKSKHWAIYSYASRSSTSTSDKRGLRTKRHMCQATAWGDILLACSASQIIRHDCSSSATLDPNSAELACHCSKFKFLTWTVYCSYVREHCKSQI